MSRAHLKSASRLILGKHLLGGVLAASTMLALGASGCSTEGEDGVASDVCVSTEEYFATAYFKVFRAKCATCHQVGSIGAEQSDFDLKPSSEAGFLDSNLEALKKVASYKSGEEGVSILLEKPLGKLDHGGGAVLKESDPEYETIRELVTRLEDGSSCPNTQARYVAGIELLGPDENLIKASLALAARLPTQEEADEVKANGWEGFDKVVGNYMGEDAFYLRVKEKYNDLLLTDFYLNNGNFDVIGDGDFYDPRWFENVPATQANIKKYGARDANDMYERLERYTTRAVAQQSLELIAHVIRENKPFTEVLTADYMVLNPFSAAAYRIPDVTFDNDANPNEYKEAKLGGYDYGFPHAGVLSDPIWLARHPTTPTNRARHRAREVLYVWMANDILKAAERPLDITQIDLKQSPTQNEVTCTVCHKILDPIAGGFRNFQNDNQFAYEPDNLWFNDMFPPGFKDGVMPAGKYGEAMPWMAREVTNDPSFSFAAVFTGFRIVTGQEPLTPPADPADPRFSYQLNAYLGQYYTLSKIAEDFRNNGYNFKMMVRDLVKSPYFRAKNTAPDIAPIHIAQMDGIGTAHLLTPEQLNRKVENVLGIPWGPDFDWYDGSNLLRANGGQGYRLLFGGIDSENVTNRISVPNGIMANVIERMGLEMGCRLVGAEFSIPLEERRWLTLVDVGVEPEDVNNYPIPEAERAIRQQIQVLHERLLGEKLEVGDPELERTYKLFLDTWKDGKFNVAAVDLDGDGNPESGFPWECQSDRNYITGVMFPDEYPERFSDDGLYTGRAWSAVLAYLLTDYSFVYE